MGAEKWRDEYSDSLRSKSVTIISDNDEAGAKHAEQVARSLHLKAASIKIAKLPEGIKDLSEWLGLSGEELQGFIDAAQEWSESASSQAKLLGLSTKQLLEVTVPNVKWLAWLLLAPGFSSILGTPESVAHSAEGGPDNRSRLNLVAARLTVPNIESRCNQLKLGHPLRFERRSPRTPFEPSRPAADATREVSGSVVA
jgi:hypothetical protein